MSRHPYTYAADFMRMYGPKSYTEYEADVQIPSPTLSRADAAHLRAKIAAAIGMSDEELAVKLSEAYQAEMGMDVR